MTDAEVRSGTSAEIALWKVAVEAEYNDSFVKMNAVSIATPADIESIGGFAATLPMKVVWSVKPGGRRKCRAVVCGNFERKNPTEQVWTAQAETISVLAGVRLALLNDWVIGKVDVKGAFMYAPLPDHSRVIVRPPRAWERMGVVETGVAWVLQRAVYGLRISPKAWGDERDRQLTRVRLIDAEHRRYRLSQCINDTQVWRITTVDDHDHDLPGGLVGLVITYVDDLLILVQSAALRGLFTAELRKKCRDSPVSNISRMARSLPFWVWSFSDFQVET